MLLPECFTFTWKQKRMRKKSPKWLAVWNTSCSLHVSGLQLLISWAPLDTHWCLLIFCLTHVLANQSVVPGFYAHSHALVGTGHCLTFTWPAVQHPGNLKTWKYFAREGENIFLDTKLSKPRVISYASHDILKSFPLPFPLFPTSGKTL